MSADTLHEPSNRIYEKYFLWALRRRMLQKARHFPDHFDTSRLRDIRSLREFDDKVTAHYCGFTGVDDYYDRASAAHVVERIAVPALVLHAANDPFIRITAETRRKISANRNITFVETADGGHCAFIGSPVGVSAKSSTRSGAGVGNGNDGCYDDGYWAEHAIVNFLRAF
jgi:predicted alpha/beta-fold hydrolase